MKSFLLVVCIFITSSVSVYGQQEEGAFFPSGKSKESKIFKNAIIEGRQSGHFYIVRNDKGKNISTDDLLICAKENDFLVGNTSKKEIKRFGDFSTVFNVFEFLPKQEFPQYVFECMCPNRDYSSMRNNGSVYVCKSDKNEKVVFEKNSNAMWSGDVGENGKIIGKGYGFIEVSPTHFIQFEGTFHNGIPEGSVSFNEYQRDHYGKFDNRTTNWQIQTGPFILGKAWFKSPKGLYGFIDADGNIIHDPIFNSVSDYNDEGISTVEKAGYNFLMNKNGTLLYFKPKGTIILDDMLDFCKKNPEFREAIGNTIMLAAENEPMRKLMDIEERFPELASRLLPFKNKLYNPKADSLMNAYNKAVNAAKGEVKYDDLKEYENVAQKFLKKTYDEFDPRNLRPKAKDLCCFCNIVRVLEIDFLKVVRSSNNYYIMDSKEIMFLNYDIYDAERECEMLKNEKTDFQEYATKAYDILKRRHSQYTDAKIDKAEKFDQMRLADLKKIKVGSRLRRYGVTGELVITGIVEAIDKSGKKMKVKIIELKDSQYEFIGKVGDVVWVNPYLDNFWRYVRPDSK